jgi:dephospho-CoA kinase
MKHVLNVNREVSVVKIALTGKMRSGKDTVAHQMYIRHSFNRVAFGDAMKKNAHATFPWISEFSKPRALYQQYAQLMRQIDSEVWIKHAKRAVQGAIDFRVHTDAESVGVVITDLRQPNEYEWARANGFTLIRVSAPDEDRIARAKIAGDDFNKADLEHETESHIDSFNCDYEIANAGSLDELKEQIDTILSQINGVK